MSDPAIPDTWSAYVPILAGLFRTVLAAAGASGFTWAAAVTGSQIDMVASAVMMLFAAGWSAWQKIGALRKAHEAATSSAIASSQATMAQGMPVAVVVAPKA